MKEAVKKSCQDRHRKKIHPGTCGKHRVSHVAPTLACHQHELKAKEIARQIKVNTISKIHRKKAAKYYEIDDAPRPPSYEKHQPNYQCYPDHRKHNGRKDRAAPEIVNTAA